MGNLSNIQLRRLDLTLLLVLSEALRTRKLGTVARTLGLTPSAISHALSRLRDIFGDPLFMRRPSGVEPTARALELAEPVARALEALGQALQPAEFSPARIKRTFHIAALDYLITIHAPGLIETVRSQAPDARLAFVNFGRQEALQGLTEGRIDLAIGVFAPDPKRIARTVIGSLSFVTVARKKHPALRRGLTLERYVALDHIIVSGTGDFIGPIDTVLGRQGLQRRVIAALPQFLASLASVAASDAIASVPTGIAERYAELFDLKVFALPLAMPRTEFVAVHGLHGGNDRALQWLLGVVPRLER